MRLVFEVRKNVALKTFTRGDASINVVVIFYRQALKTEQRRDIRSGGDPLIFNFNL